MRKKPMLKAAFILMLLLSAVAVTQLVSLAKGNPFSQSAYSGERYPSAKVNPPEVSIISPQNDRTYSTRDVLLTLNASTKGSKTLILGDFHYISSIGIKEVYFTADWLQNETMIYRSPRIEDHIDNTAKFFFMGDWYDKYQDLPAIDFEKLSLNLTNIPDGNHTIRVYAVGSGSEHYIFNWYVFYVTGASKVNFVVDATPPKITVLPLENKTYLPSDLPLNFTVNEPVSQVAYSLDGQTNMTITGNTTITDLPSGEHNVTVYATDNVGNTGASETIYFSVEEPTSFPTTMIMAPTALVIVVSLALLVYFKKRKAHPLTKLRPRVKTKTLFTIAFYSMILLPMAIGILPIQNVSGNFVLYPESVPEGIRINANGSVEGTAKIQRNGNTYTLTGDIYRTIAVLRDGIVLDGQDHTLQGNGAGSGVFLQERNSVTIKNLKINNFQYGIKFTWLTFGNQPIRRNNKIIGNTISNNKYGIAFYDYSEGNLISDNYIAYNSHGIQLQQSNNVLRNNKFVGNNFSISDYSAKINDIDESNTVNGKPVYYWVDQHGKLVSSDAGWVVLKNCSRITVENLHLQSNAQAIFLYNTNSTTIKGNSVTNNAYGIVLLTSSNNTISNNNLTKNTGYGIQISSESNNNSIIENRIWENTGQGISVGYSNGTNISKNYITANECGIKLEFAKKSDITENNVTSNTGNGIELSFETCNNTISRNYISKNALGITMGPTWQHIPAGNIITENTIKENNGWGIKLDPTQNNNLIHHNNFIDNNVTEGLQVSNPGQWTYRDRRGQWLPGNPNSWDDGKEGNYWSDYETRYPDAAESGNSGVWNAPFYINENNVDSFPLVSPWEIPSPERENEAALIIGSFPTTLAIASFVTLSVFGFGFLLNLVKRKRAREQ